MKKILTRIFAIMVLIICALSLVACNIFADTPNLNLEEAEANLEEKNYGVSYLTFDEEEIGGYGIYVGLTEMLIAYGEDNNDDMVMIMVFKSRKFAKLFYNYIESELNMEIDEIMLQIELNNYMLKNFKDELDRDEIADYEDEIEELKKELAEVKEEGVIGIKGKAIWIGTKDAINNTK